MSTSSTYSTFVGSVPVNPNLQTRIVIMEKYKKIIYMHSFGYNNVFNTLSGYNNTAIGKASIATGVYSNFLNNG